MATKTLLIIEDEKPLLLALTEKFKREGFNVFGAKDGQEGIEMAMQLHPDLILLDVVMPKKDGMSMLRELREDEWGKTAPVIFLTNLSDYDNVSKAIEQGAFDYLVKTYWTLDGLVKKVKAKLAGVQLDGSPV